MEVVDGWLTKLYPKTPTWREIADVVEHISHSSLADSIRQVYVTGETFIFCSDKTKYKNSTSAIASLNRFTTHRSKQCSA